MTRLSSKMEISQSASFENCGNLLFISLEIDFSSFSSASSSLLLYDTAGAERDGEMTVLVDDDDEKAIDGVVDGVGDGGRNELLAFAILTFDLTFGYLVGSFRSRPNVGRFQ